MNIDSPVKRNFYLEESIKANWSVRQLERQINSFYYERLISTSDNYKDEVRNEINTLVKKENVHDFIKDPYVLEFLDIKDRRYLEKDLESNLLEHISEFLLELGRGFSFVSRQRRIDVDGDNFYIDLVFYNYVLKCFVLIDLKLEKLTHQDIGQMDFYVRYFDNEVKDNLDNPTIGIILCSDKKDTIVKYSVLNDKKNLFASRYQLYLPTERELALEIEKQKAIRQEQIRLEKIKQQQEEKRRRTEQEEKNKIRIPFNSPTHLSYKPKEEIYDLRKHYVNKSIFADANYEPSNEVFGQIESNKPWNSIKQCLYERTNK